MDEFISMVTDKLGIGETESRSVTGGILKMLKDQLDDTAFGSLLEKIPGADALVEQSEAAAAEPDSGSGGGLMGSLTSMAGSLLGGGDSGMAGVVKIVGDSGIGLDKAGGFLSALISFLKEKLGDEMFSNLAAKLPDLLGGSDD